MTISNMPGSPLEFPNPLEFFLAAYNHRFHLQTYTYRKLVAYRNILQ